MIYTLLISVKIMIKALTINSKKPPPKGCLSTFALETSCPVHRVRQGICHCIFGQFDDPVIALIASLPRASHPHAIDEERSLSFTDDSNVSQELHMSKHDAIIPYIFTNVHKK